MPALDLPERVLVTDTHTNDCLGLDLLILDDPAWLQALCGQTLVFDLGYYSHARFASLLAAGVHFVSRLNLQASLQVEEELPIQHHFSPGRIEILSDQRVTVGSANNRAGAVLPGLRLVTARVQPSVPAAHRGAQPIIYHILTDRWDLQSLEVIQIYLWRWQIELLFRWLKSHVHLTRLLGHSQNAVELTVWLAIVVHLLTVLAAQALGYSRRTPALLSQLGRALEHIAPQDMSEARLTGRQLILPGWEDICTAPT
jgi:putative transposase